MTQAPQPASPSSRIIASGAAFPSQTVSNRDLAERFEKPEDYFHEKTGIRVRTITRADESAHDLALAASRQAMNQALELHQVSPTDIELVICATMTAAHIMPCEACMIQKDLGLVNATAYDLSAACSGWLYAYQIADQFIRGGAIRHALVIGVDTLSKLTDPADRGTSMLFGDGAGATVVTRAVSTSSSGVLAISTRSKGEGGPQFIVPNGGSAVPLTAANVNDPGRYMKMKGMEVYRHSVNSMTERCEEVFAQSGLSASDIDVFIPHQANINIAYAVGERLGIPRDKIIENIEMHGNVSSACLPTAIDRGMRDGRLTTGKLVLMSAFGAGFTTGAALVRW